MKNLAVVLLLVLSGVTGASAQVFPPDPTPIIHMTVQAPPYATSLYGYPVTITMTNMGSRREPVLADAGMVAFSYAGDIVATWADSGYTCTLFGVSGPPTGLQNDGWCDGSLPYLGTVTITVWVRPIDLGCSIPATVRVMNYLRSYPRWYGYTDTTVETFGYFCNPFFGPF